MLAIIFQQASLSAHRRNFLRSIDVLQLVRLPGDCVQYSLCHTLVLCFFRKEYLKCLHRSDAFLALILVGRWKYQSNSCFDRYGDCDFLAVNAAWSFLTLPFHSSSVIEMMGHCDQEMQSPCTARNEASLDVRGRTLILGTYQIFVVLWRSLKPGILIGTLRYLKPFSTCY